ncbi:YcxB family protein [Streptacidiphilus sp. P02-A3a]|uniref:YcxB family protein n=1 Tax=Streptacidiphilus sp. P02-A3a TaxID=2704468 RepID=UPI0015FDB6B5|nr:YcxB family protein [Streptacidiphilus sp. P02-A3a]QMU68298.1 YcxB family protein [Streptacidiphilus sp. P02-A3a]
MGVTVSFDLTTDQVQDALRYTRTGLFANWVRGMADKGVALIAPRLAGPTTLELSEAGVRISTGAGVQELGWADVATVNERQQGWVIQQRPRGVTFIPASAVAAEERAALSQQLRAWVGAKYKVREGGLAAPVGVTG